MPPKFLYFDLGKVLLSFSYGRMYRQMADVAGISPELVEVVLFRSGAPQTLALQFECGQITGEEMYERFCAATDSRPERDALELAFNDIFEPITDMMALVERLATAGNRLGILSNTCVLHWEFISDGRFPTLRRPGAADSPIEVAVTSFQVGIMKPGRGIYEAAVRSAGVPASDVFFTDDRPENVEGALAAGMHAVLFTDAGGLIDALRERGVLGVS